MHRTVNAQSQHVIYDTCSQMNTEYREPTSDLREQQKCNFPSKYTPATVWLMGPGNADFSKPAHRAYKKFTGNFTQ